MSACREVTLAGNGPADRTPPRPVVVYVGGEWDGDSLAIQNGVGVLDLANEAAYGGFFAVAFHDRSHPLEPDAGFRTGTMRGNAVPGVRIENLPFGGSQDSGLGIEEGGIEFRKFMRHTQSFSLPW